MLTFYGSKNRSPFIVADDAARLPEGVDWIDALTPTPTELDTLQRLLGVRVPTQDDLAEIESSSRLSMEGDVIVMSLPASVRGEDGYPHATPVGFVVGRACVATIRFADLPSFKALVRKMAAADALTPGGTGATTTLFEAMVDQLADILERASGELDAISRQIFTNGLGTDGKSAPKRSNRVLGDLLRSVGRCGDLASKVSESLLALSRMAPYLMSKAATSMTPELKGRLDAVASDAHSLREFEDGVSQKTAFLLDALLGFSNIEQNNVFRILTIVSVVGIPPTFFASMYGMNFKNMPEYDWAHGYAYGLTLIACSAIAPAIWFKIKGWW